MFHEKENSDHRDIKQDDLFTAIDTQQNEREILRDVVWAVLSDQMALAMAAPDFVDVLADELQGTGVAAAIISDVKMLVGAQGSDKQAIEKRIRDVVIFQQNRLLQQQTQDLGAEAEMSLPDQVPSVQVAQPVIVIPPVSDAAYDIQETVIEETSLEETSLEEINLEEIDTEVSVEEIITLENFAEEFQPVSVDENDIDHAIAQKIDADVSVISNQDGNDAAPDAVPVAMDSDTELEEDFIVNEDDCTIAVSVVQPVALASDIVMSMDEAEHDVNMAVAPLAQTILSPAEIENGIVDPVVQNDDVYVADIQNSLAVIEMPSEHVVPTEIEQQPVVQTSVPSVPTSRMDKAAKEIAPIQNVAPEIVAEGVNEFSNKASKEIIAEDSLNISPVVVQADAVEQYVIVSDDVVSAAMAEIMLPVAESVAEAKRDIPYHADERVEREIVAENPVQIQAQNIAMPQSHGESSPVQVQIHNPAPDPVQELVQNHIQPQEQASSLGSAEIMPSVIIMNPVEEGKSIALIQDNAKDVMTAPDVFSLHPKEAPVTQQGDWYGDILNAQINSFYGSMVSYDAVADDEPKTLMNIQRPMKPIAA